MPLAEVGYLTTRATFGKYADISGVRIEAGALGSDVTRAIEASCNLVVDSIWHPYLSALVRRGRVKKVKRLVEALIDAPDKETEWGRGLSGRLVAGRTIGISSR